MKKNFILTMVFTLFFSTMVLSIGTIEASAATMKPVPGSPGWKYRVDGPHVDGVNNDWHVHVEKGKIKGAERVTGGKSHNKTLDSAGVPKTVQKNVKKTSDFKKALEKQKKLDAERKKVSKYSWSQILWNPVVYLATIASLIGVTVGKLIMNPRLIFG
ncbi:MULTISPECIES: hypothetical protein [Bacillus subtilis group]|jgi:hypothetical protein|uniref:hypothetical protein n=1 Tax=Bacillus subtilis group TaxID=653685 RepID=UPI000929C642|nr:MULTISPECIES: hypothetical protein [Bacillus subtilis group]OJT53933.1 hypothetical protein BFP47_23305 [Bacillus licheniformis]OJT54553.1 hypothetical protein BFP49_23265 [Bacillus licheniformis]OJT66478.1 hypothetical protein BFP46_24685 [Bacillus licheniformis]OKS80282.1 hypothetical protein BFN05_21805 [Bacillus licheniformis]QII51502.1 hypothetical protein G3M81_23385 [Bacillus paralicheniformis]